MVNREPRRTLAAALGGGWDDGKGGLMTWLRAQAVRRAAAWGAAASFAVFLAAEAPATPLLTNLIINPGAEASAGATDFLTTAAPAGWSTTGNFSAVQYAAGGAGDLNPTDSAAVGGGGNYFAGGPANAMATAAQTIIIADLAASIDAGLITALFDAYLGGWQAQNDSMVIQATFRDASFAPLGSLTLGPVDVTDRNLESTLLFRATSGPVPVGTRAVDIVMTATRTAGSYNDGYADNLSFRLEQQQIEIAEPQGVALAALGLFALGMLGLARRKKAANGS